MEGSDRAAASPGHQVLTEAMIGRNLVMSLDCKSCHKTAEKSIGPSYTDVAQRYEKNTDAINYLTQKIIKGGSGYGESRMPALQRKKRCKTDGSWIRTLAGNLPKVKAACFR